MNPPIVRALIVEDDRSWQQVLSEILTDAGLTVDVADNLEGAIAALRATAHRLAIVDLSLGGGDYHNQDGLRVLEAVRRLDPGCVTVLLTGFATVELAVSALTEHGAFTCLRKETFHRTQFRELIGQALTSISPAGIAHHPDHTPADSSPTDGTGEVVDRETLGGLALVVEDDAGWRSILDELLTDAGYQVRLCSSFGEALGCLRRETYALAVVDLSLASLNTAGISLWGSSLPDQDLEGYRLLASTQAAGTPTIVVSGVATPADIERAYSEHSVFAFIEKQTFDRRAFLLTVEEACVAGGINDDLECLTRREREALALLAQGLTNKEIAETLVITTNTVKRHLKAIFEKMEVHTRSAAVAKAVGAGFPVTGSLGSRQDSSEIKDPTLPSR
jgi:DNA-binding NarL/FixJ family response regulator